MLRFILTKLNTWIMNLYRQIDTINRIKIHLKRLPETEKKTRIISFDFQQIIIYLLNISFPPKPENIFCYLSPFILSTLCLVITPKLQSMEPKNLIQVYLCLGYIQIFDQESAKKFHPWLKCWGWSFGIAERSSKSNIFRKELIYRLERNIL